MVDLLISKNLSQTLQTILETMLNIFIKSPTPLCTYYVENHTITTHIIVTFSTSCMDLPLVELFWRNWLWTKVPTRPRYFGEDTGLSWHCFSLPSGMLSFSEVPTIWTGWALWAIQQFLCFCNKKPKMLRERLVGLGESKRVKAGESGLVS